MLPAIRTIIVILRAITLAFIAIRASSSSIKFLLAFIQARRLSMEPFEATTTLNTFSIYNLFAFLTDRHRLMIILLPIKPFGAGSISGFYSRLSQRKLLDIELGFMNAFYDILQRTAKDVIELIWPEGPQSRSRPGGRECEALS